MYLNVAVRDLKKSIDFFTALGFTFNPQFTDEKATCLVIEEGSIYAMLVTEPFFQTFIPGKDFIDAKKHTEALIALTAASREEVDSMLEKVVAAGGRDYRKEDHGWMYSRAFEDLDGHIWEFFYIDETQIPKNP